MDPFVHDHATSHPPHRRSEHEVNTPRVVLKASSMRHTEGGWPKDVDPGEQADVTRFRKKVGSWMFWCWDYLCRWGLGMDRY